MAKTKITALTELTDTNIAIGDLIPIVDISDTSQAASGTTKKVTITSLATAVASAFSGDSPTFVNLNTTGTTTLGDSGDATTVNGTLAVGAITSSGALALGSNTITSGAITSGLINSQTISSAANFTGTLGVTGLLTVDANIKFPATQVASANANTLDDYEEGTWTAAVVPVSGTVTMGNSSARYVKIGSVVTLTGFITISSVSSPSGAVGITGLPFSSNISTAYWSGCSAQDSLSTKNKIYLPSNGSVQFDYAQYNDADLGSALTGGWNMILSFSYIVA